MSLEIILWITAWLLTTEILFMWSIKRGNFDGEEWISEKAKWCVVSGFFYFIQLMIVRKIIAR